MTPEAEHKMVAKMCDDAIARILDMRQQWLQMANYVHNTYCGNETTHLWRQCKNPICRRFLEIVKRDKTRRPRDHT